MNWLSRSWMVSGNRLKILIDLKGLFSCIRLLEVLVADFPSSYLIHCMTSTPSCRMCLISCFPQRIWRAWAWLSNLTTSPCVIITLWGQARWCQHLAISRQLPTLKSMVDLNMTQSTPAAFILKWILSWQSVSTVSFATTRTQVRKLVCLIFVGTYVLVLRSTRHWSQTCKLTSTMWKNTFNQSIQTKTSLIIFSRPRRSSTYNHNSAKLAECLWNNPVVSSRDQRKA